MPMSGGKSAMKRVLCVVPAAHDVGLTSVSLGLLQAFKDKGGNRLPCRSVRKISSDPVINAS